MQLDVDVFYEKLEYWCDVKGISVYRLSKISEVNASTLYNAKAEKRHVSFETAIKVISSLDLTVDQFLGIKSDDSLDDYMLEVNNIAKDFSLEQKQRLISYAKFLKTESKDTV